MARTLKDIGKNQKEVATLASSCDWIAQSDGSCPSTEGRTMQQALNDWGRRSRVLAAIAMIGFTSASSCRGAEGIQARFAPERDYGPFVYVGEDGKARGLSVELLTAIAPYGGLTLQTTEPADLNTILAQVREGKVDLVSSLRPTPERAAFLDFSPTYVDVPAVLVMRSGAEKRYTLADLQGAKVGVGKAYAVESFVRTKHPQVDWVSLPNDLLALKALARGELRAVVADAASVQFLRKQEALPDLDIHGAIGFQYSLSFGVRKDRPDIQSAVKQGLQKLPRGERDAIVARWMQLDDQTYRPPALGRVQNILWVLGGIAVALGLVLVGRKLRRTAGAKP